ncbi:MAG: hypothetical protein J6I96_00910 [Oscillospiraceae bacterium]|nr:hypothetical protein [Oscillospiraceae bacterium]
MKKAAVLLAAMTLTGCSFGTPVENLLSPPVMSQIQEDIQNALTDAVGSDITPVYPRSGEYRSAYVICDLDGDGREEAVAFYRNEDDPSRVRVNVLSNEDGWHSVFDHAAPGSSVESVYITKFSSDNIYLAVGYGYAARADKTLCVYDYTDGRLANRYSEVYSRLEYVDINLDGGDDIVLLNGNTDEHPAYASLVTDTGEGVDCTSAVRMRNTTAELVHSVSGGLGGGAAAVFADSASASGNISTEIIYCVEGELRDPAAMDDSEIPSLTSRRGLYSTDIDGDGVVEIPTIEPFPGYRDTESQYVTNWNVYENYTLVNKYSSLYEPKSGYCFMLPVRWDGLVTVRTDSSSGEKVFYKFNTTLAESRLELMRIAVCAPSQKDDLELKGYYEVISGAETIMVQAGDTDDTLVLTPAEVENGMYAVK